MRIHIFFCHVSSSDIQVRERTFHWGEEPLVVGIVSIAMGASVFWACKSSTWDQIASTSSCCCLMVVLCCMRISRMYVTCIVKHWTAIWSCYKSSISHLYFFPDPERTSEPYLFCEAFELRISLSNGGEFEAKEGNLLDHQDMGPWPKGEAPD